MQVELGRGTRELVAQPQNEEGPEKDADIWRQETHNVPWVHQAESVNTRMSQVGSLLSFTHKAKNSEL